MHGHFITFFTGNIWTRKCCYDALPSSSLWYHFFHFYIQSFWLNMLRSNRGCVYVRVCVRVCVCACVCLSVCVSATAQTAEPILIKFCMNDLYDVNFCSFSQILKFRIGWRHSSHFIPLPFRHDHGRNFYPIVFKFEDNVESCFGLFAI